MVARTRHRLLAFVAVALASAPVPVRADAPLLAHAAGDAALILHAELDSIEPLANTILRPFGLTFPLLAERALVAAFGWNPLSRSGWQSFGVTGQHLLVEITPRGVRLLFVGNAETTGATLRVTPMLKVLPKPRGRDVLYAGESKLLGQRAVLLRRLSGGLVAIDLMDTLRLPADAPAAPLPLRVQAFLQEPGVNLWSSNTRADAFLTQSVSAARANALCVSLKEYAAIGPIEDLLLRVAPTEHGLAATLHFIARNEQLRAAFTRKATAAPSPPKDAAAGAVLAIGPRQIVNSIPRPVALETLENFRIAQNQCGARANLGLYLFAWPAALSLFFDEVGKSHANAERVLRGAGALVLAVRNPAPEPERFVGAASLGLDKDTTALAEELLVTVFGKGTAEGKRHLAFGSGPMKARLDRRGQLVLGLGTDALPWWQKHHAARGAPLRPFLDLHWRDPGAVTWISERAGAPFATRFLEAFPSGLLSLELQERDLELRVQLSRTPNAF